MMGLAMSTPREHTVIAGLSATGLSVAEHLLAHGESVVIADSRQNPPGLQRLQKQYPNVPVFCGGFAEDLLMGATRLMVSPGIPLTTPFVQKARRQGLPVVGDIELFAQVANAPVVAITGSNGKSTVTTLVGEMAKDAGKRAPMGGNIGIPALNIYDEDAPDFYILELSSFQLDTTRSLRAKAAVVLNISEDHMDRYSSVAEYAESKKTIYRGCDVTVVNRDDPAAAALADESPRTVSYGLKDATNVWGIVLHNDEAWLAQRGKRLLRCADMNMPGLHNVSNALAALALGQAVGLPVQSMIETLKRFTGLPHRTQFLTNRRGVRWYNDSKGTNVGATLAAIQGFAPPLVLIAGGVGKDADFAPLKTALERKAKAVILLGEDKQKIADALKESCEIHFVDDMEAAVLKANDITADGDVVLLSPACASFDMFSGFEQRGLAFADAVRRLGE